MSADYFVFREDDQWAVQAREPGGVDWWHVAGPYDTWSEAFESAQRLASGVFE